MKTLFVLPSLKTNKQYKNNITLILLNNCEVKTCFYRSRKKNVKAKQNLFARVCQKIGE